MSSPVGSLNAAALKAIRELQRPRVTQDAIAAAVGIDQPYYSKIENGVIKPRPELIMALAEHLGVTRAAISNPRAECPDCAGKAA